MENCLTQQPLILQHLQLVTINKPRWTYNSQQTKSFNRLLNASYVF